MILIAVKVASDMYDELKHPGSIAMLHLISLSQCYQQPCKASIIVSILQMKLQGLKEFKPKVIWLGKGIARIEFQVCLLPESALGGEVGEPKEEKRKHDIIQ